MSIFFETETCLFPSCFDKNIKSHAISRRFSLGAIAENYHLYHFLPRQISRDEKIPYLKKISTLKATAHDGFCEIHDGFFKKLDTEEISTSKDILLQAYRSLCIIYNQEKSSAISLYALNSVNAYESIDIEMVKIFLESNGHSKLISRLDNIEVLNIVKKKIFSLFAESIDDDLLQIERLSDYLFKIREYNDEVVVPVGELQTFTTENMSHVMFYYKTDFQIPVSINSLLRGEVHEVDIKCYSIVVPYKESNVIIGLVPKELLEGNDYFADKINNYFSSRTKVIKFVESVMSTSDNWFVKPSIIDDMNVDKQEFFRQDCMFYNERKLFEEYDFSIFDALKLSVCCGDQLTALNEEITHIPQREEYSVRYEKMMEKILESHCDVVF